MDELADDALPVVAAPACPDAKRGQPLVAAGVEPLGGHAQQDVGDVRRTVALAHAVHAGQRHLGILRGVVGLRRIEADVAIAAILTEVLPEVPEKRPPPAGEPVAVGDHALEFVQLHAHLFRIAPPPAVRGAAALDERTDDGGVAEAEEQQARRRAGRRGRRGRSPGSSSRGLRQVAVDDEADVGLVDAHAERDGGDDHVHLVADEGVLVRVARSGRSQARVVGPRP